jgi:putative SOS response-associated peptidase YedK
MPDGAGEAFTLLTTESEPGVAPIHDRWSSRIVRIGSLALTSPVHESELLRPLPAGSLMVEQVR